MSSLGFTIFSPADITFDRTAGSQSLAAAGQRVRHAAVGEHHMAPPVTERTQRDHDAQLCMHRSRAHKVSSCRHVPVRGLVTLTLGGFLERSKE